jgi:uncharacterized membrane protein
MKYKYYLLLFLYLAALTSAIFLSVKPLPEICSPQEGCSIVLSTTYAQIAGIKVSLLGIIALSLTLAIIITQIIKKDQIKRKIINTMVIIGGLLALRFLYLQEFVIHSFCKYCLISDISLTISMILTIIFWKD